MPRASHAAAAAAPRGTADPARTHRRAGHQPRSPLRASRDDHRAARRVAARRRLPRHLPPARGGLRHLLRTRGIARRSRVRSDCRHRPDQGLSPERLEEAVRQPRRSARAHRQGMPRPRAVPAAAERSALRAPADAARDAEARYAREPAAGRRRSVGRAQPADTAQADAQGRMTQMAKRSAGLRVLTLAVAGAAPAPAAAWGFEPHKYIMGGRFTASRGDPSVLRQVPDVDRRARHRSGSVAHRRLGAGAAAALPRHGRVRALSVPQLPARARRSGQALRPRLRRPRTGSCRGAPRRFTGSWSRRSARRRRTRATTSSSSRRSSRHYVSDAHVPFHAVLNYDGQLTGQLGIHRASRASCSSATGQAERRPETGRADRQPARLHLRDADFGLPAGAADPRRGQGGGRRDARSTTTSISRCSSIRCGRSSSAGWRNRSARPRR